MANFAVIENEIVINVIVAESKEIAEEVTEKTCVEFTESNNAYIGGKYDGVKFYHPSETPTIPLDNKNADTSTKS